jgi:hypothetical protein
MRSRPIEKFTRAAERMLALALETVASTAPTIRRSAPIDPMNPVATSATRICESASASMDSVPVETHITLTYIRVGVITESIIASGRSRLGFLISPAVVAMTSKPMKVTYTVSTVAATAGHPFGSNSPIVGPLRNPNPRNATIRPTRVRTITFWSAPVSSTPS